MSDIKSEKEDVRGIESKPFLGPASPQRLAMRDASSMSSLSNSPGASILAYCLASISMTVVNKYVVSGDDWNLYFFYLAVQAIVCSAAIVMLRQMGMIKLAPYDGSKVKKWIPVSILFVGMLYTGTKSLKYLSVPVYTIFKNLTIIVIAYGEVLWFGGRVTSLALLSFGLMVLSSVVAAWADIQSVLNGDSAGDATSALSTLNAGYTWMGLNVFCTAARLLSMKKVIKQTAFSDWDNMYYSNLLTIPLLVVASLIFEDWSGANLARNFPPETRNGLMLGMVYSGLGGVFISYCSVWCLRVTSSTTFSMVGALNKLPIAISGLIFFAAPVTVGSVSAIAIGFISGLVYAWAKAKEKKSNQMSLPTTQPMSASAQSARDANRS